MPLQAQTNAPAARAIPLVAQRGGRQERNLQEPDVQERNLQKHDAQEPNLQEPNLRKPDVQKPNPQERNPRSRDARKPSPQKRPVSLRVQPKAPMKPTARMQYAT